MVIISNAMAAAIGVKYQGVGDAGPPSGRPSDMIPISAREKAFAPIMLSEMLKTAVVKDSMNRKIPL